VVLIEKVYETPSARERTVVLWVSRHPPLRAQVDELERRLGPIVVYQLSGVIPSAEYVVERARELSAKYVVPVLPLSFVAVLVEQAKRAQFVVLFAKMKLLAVLRTAEEAKKLVAEAPEGRVYERSADGSYRVFEFERFEKLVEVRLVTEPL